MKKKLYLLSITAAFVFMVFSPLAKASTKISNIELINMQNGNYKIGIHFDGAIPQGEITSRKGMLQIAFERAVAWPKIEKMVPFNGGPNATLMAYQFDKDTARVRLMIPGKKSLNPKDVIWKNVGRTYWAEFNVNGTTVSKKKRATSYDEKYLDNLLTDVKKSEAKKTKTKKVDQVVVSQSAIKKNGSFDVMKYISKFAAFLGLMLLFLYGFVQLFKKGAFSKSKLNFLKNMNTIEVLNTNHLGSKRNLMLVKVQGQVFLIGNSDKGMHFLSEIDDVAGLVKDQEKEISGSNFDSNLSTADDNKKDFKLKEIRAEIAATNVESKKSKDKKLSDHIKNKIKDMKALQ